jgi:hypothetical protein
VRQDKTRQASEGKRKHQTIYLSFGSLAMQHTPGVARLVGGGSGLDDDVGCLLARHVDGHSNIHAGNLGEDGRVNDTKAVDATDAEFAVEDGHRVVVGANGGGAGGVVAPGLVTGELLEVLLRADILGGPDALKRTIKRDKALKGLDAVLHTLDDGLEILVATLGEGFEVDAGSVAGVGRGQVDGAGVVATVSLQREPGPDVEVLGGMQRVSGEIAVEVGGDTTEEQVRLVARDGGVVKVTKGNTVGGVGTLEITR